MAASQCVARPWTSRDSQSEPSRGRPCTVVTLLERHLHAQIALAGGELFHTLAVESVEDLAAALQGRNSRAAILSPRLIRTADLPALAAVGREFAGPLIVAMSTNNENPDVNSLLSLGACGVRHLLDFRDRHSFTRLRDLIGQPYAGVADEILDAVMLAIAQATPDARFFFDRLVRTAPSMSSIRALARRIDVLPSTLMSRFFRAHLPSPKRYLAEARILYAAALLEERRYSIAEVSNRLCYSSPQSFGRHLRQLRGLSAAEFRYRFSLRTALTKFTADLLVPYEAALKTFVPMDRRWQGRLEHRPLAMVAEP